MLSRWRGAIHRRAHERELYAHLWKLPEKSCKTRRVLEGDVVEGKIAEQSGEILFNQMVVFDRCTNKLALKLNKKEHTLKGTPPCDAVTFLFQSRKV